MKAKKAIFAIAAAVLIPALLLTLSGTLLAKSKQGKSSKFQIVDFEDALIEGELRKPYGSMLSITLENGDGEIFEIGKDYRNRILRSVHHLK